MDTHAELLVPDRKALNKPTPMSLYDKIFLGKASQDVGKSTVLLEHSTYHALLFPRYGCFFTRQQAVALEYYPVQSRGGCVVTRTATNQQHILHIGEYHSSTVVVRTVRLCCYSLHVHGDMHELMLSAVRT